MAAVDDKDLVALGAIAERLRYVATKHGWPRIAEGAAALAGAVDRDGDLTSLLETTRTLLDLCNELHDACLEAARSPAKERQVRLGVCVTELTQTPSCIQKKDNVGVD